MTILPRNNTRTLLTLQGESNPSAINAQTTPSALGSQTIPVSQESNDVNPLKVTELVFAILLHCNLQTFGRLSRVNQFFNACVRNYIEQLDLKRFCPNLQILDAKAQGLSVNDELPVSKGWILKNYTELECHVDSREGLTLLTMSQGLTLNQLIAIGADKRQTVDVLWEQIVNEYGNVPIEQNYVILITNGIFQQSRNKSYAKQQELVAGHGCKLPTVQEYVALCVFTNKVFQRCLYRQNPLTYGRTSIQTGGYPLIVGGSVPTRLVVEGDFYGDEDIGVGGQRKFGY